MQKNKSKTNKSKNPKKSYEINYVTRRFSTEICDNHIYIYRGIMSNTGHFLCYQITFLFMIIN